MSLHFSNLPARSNFLRGEERFKSFPEPPYGRYQYVLATNGLPKIIVSAGQLRVLALIRQEALIGPDLPYVRMTNSGDRVFRSTFDNLKRMGLVLEYLIDSGMRTCFDRPQDLLDLWTLSPKGRRYCDLPPEEDGLVQWCLDEWQHNGGGLPSG